jgi:hypothetical protein
MFSFFTFGRPRLAWLQVLIAALLLPPALHAHPVVKGNFNVTIESECVRFTAIVSIEEVLLASTLGTENVPASMDEAIQRHGEYILKHVALSLDENAVAGMLRSSAIIKDGVERVHFQFVFQHQNAKAPQPPPKQIRIQQRMLDDVKAPAGDPWEAAYVLNIGMENGARIEGLLARDKPVTYSCVWSPASQKTAASAATPAWWPILFVVATFLFLVIVARVIEQRRKPSIGERESDRRTG